MSQPYPFGGSKADSGCDPRAGSDALGEDGCAAFNQKTLPLFCQ